MKDLGVPLQATGLNVPETGHVMVLVCDSEESEVYRCPVCGQVERISFQPDIQAEVLVEGNTTVSHESFQGGSIVGRMRLSMDEARRMGLIDGMMTPEVVL